MPFKFHEPHRHRVPKARYRVRNWAEYDRGLVQRGDVRVWISAEALAHWEAACRSTPGGQRRFSNLAVETVLVLGALYNLPLRQTEGFVRSLIELMRLELTVPDHTTLARRRRTMQTTDFRWPRMKCHKRSAAGRHSSRSACSQISVSFSYAASGTLQLL